MELLYAFSLLLMALSVAARFHWTDRAWVMSWCSLFALAGVFRLVMDCAPLQGPRWAGWGAILLAGAVFPYRQKICSAKQFLDALPWLLCGGLLLVYSYFPQFDIDSIQYHLVGIQWLQDRPMLPLFQRHAETLSIMQHLIAFEEYLTIPGLAGDLALCAGLVGGVLKILTMGTLLSLVPSSCLLLRYAVAFFLFIDDHFFFSGQSRFVYLNPSLIGLLALLVWLSWRGSRGSVQRLYGGLAIAVGLASVKYHGLYFVPILLVAVALAAYKFFRRPVVAPWPDLASWVCLLGSVLLAWSIFGLHYLDTGSPIAPSGPVDPARYWRGTERLTVYLSTTYLQAARHPLRHLIYPGNLAMKMVAVLIVPTLLIWCMGRVRAWRGRFRIDWRLMGLAALCFGIAQIWVVIAARILETESRYPRYVMGVSILGITAFICALRKPFLPIIRKGSVGDAKPLLAGLAVFLYLVMTLDTRFVNIPPSQRPTWRQLVQFAKAHRAGHRPSVDMEAAYMAPLLVPFAVQNLIPLKHCLSDLEGPSGLQLTKGEGLLVDGDYLPSFLFANNAVFSSVKGGGGYLRLPEGMHDLRDAHIRYAIVPKEFPPDGQSGPFIRSKEGSLHGVAFDPTPVCRSPDLKLVKLNE